MRGLLHYIYCIVYNTLIHTLSLPTALFSKCWEFVRYMISFESNWPFFIVQDDTVYVDVFLSCTVSLYFQKYINTANLFLHKHQDPLYILL